MQRSRMNGDEYGSLRVLCGLVSEWDIACDTLERRLRGVPGAWRDARLIRTKTLSLMRQLLDTIDQEQLRKIARDIQNVKVRVSIGPEAAQERPYGYYDADDVALLINATAAAECMFCEKPEGEARKCPYRLAFNRMLMHRLLQVEGCEYKAFGYSIRSRDSARRRTGTASAGNAASGAYCAVRRSSRT